ncbi:DUF1289 domain-containing protein, partial [bacterium]|nr:DUF1289 domain-containing protein [bacterium]
MSAKPSMVASPCIGVCALDENDVCEGCFRTANEITRWGASCDDTKRKILSDSWQRAKD